MLIIFVKIEQSFIQSVDLIKYYFQNMFPYILYNFKNIASILKIRI